MSPAGAALGVFAAIALGCATLVAGLSARQLAARTGLGIWHPAVVWLILMTVFFVSGALLIAPLDGVLGPALNVAGALLTFGLGAWLSDRVATRRSNSGAAEGTEQPPPVEGRPSDADRPEGRGVRPWVAEALLLASLLPLIPALVEVGLPLLARDITSARIEIAGLAVQFLRVSLPGLAVLASIRAARTRATRDLWLAVGLVVIGCVFTLLLGHRYLAAELVAAVVLGLGLAGRPIRLRILTAVVAIGAVLFVGLQLIRSAEDARGQELAYLTSRTVNRLLLVQPRTLAALQAAIPAEEPYFLGLTWIHRLGPLIGRPDLPNLGYWIFPRLFPEEQPARGYAAPGLIGEAWANFGPLGLVLFVVLGVAAERLGALLALRRSSLADVTGGALLTLFLARTHALGVVGLAVLVAIVFGWRLLVAREAGVLADVRTILAWKGAPA